MRTALILAGFLLVAACTGSPSTVAEAVAEPELVWTKDERPVGPGEISSHAGPEHCEWQRATFVYLASRLYLRDPENVVGEGFRAGLRQGIRLPEDARDTGYRAGELEVWLPSSEVGAAFIRVGDDVERWPLVAAGVGCA